MVKYFLIIIILTIIACTHDQEEEDHERVTKSNRIVLIFKKPPVNNTFQFNNSIVLRNSGDHEIEYVDDNSIIRYIRLKYAPESDTIVINTEKEVQEVQLAYRGSDKLSYLFHHGDSVLFTYNGLIPTANVLNRKTLSYDINYDIIKREIFYPSENPEFTDLNDIPAAVRYYDLFNLYRGELNSVDAARKRLIQIRQEAEKARNRENRFLDSLKQQDLITPQTYRYYKTKSWYTVERLLPIIPRKESRVEGDIMSEAMLRSLIKQSSDTLLQYGFYHDFLFRIGYNYFETKADPIKFANGWQYNPKQVYDSILQNNILPKRAKAILLLKYLGEVIKTSSIEQTSTYLEKFETDVTDSALISYVVSAYNLDFENRNELQLQTLDEQNLNFENILEQFEGKLVYVDFWASWCHPCIEALPAAHLLQKEYQNQNIVFIYLSLDEDIERWKKGAEKNNLLNNSYLVRNKYTSKMVEALDIQSIPRYLLYDQRGDLIHRNAPDPKGRAIRKLLNQYL